jgi:integrase
MTLGTFPAMTLAQAHEAHGKAMAVLEKGHDPGLIQVEARAAERQAPTVELLADEYLEKWAKLWKRSWKKDAQRLERHVIPLWGRRKAADIMRRDVITMLDDIVERGTPIEANRTLALVRKMFNFALTRDIVPASPCAAVDPPGVENKRDRVLTEQEIKILWTQLDRAAMGEGTRLALKLVLVTAQRPGEVVGMSWDEVDVKQGWWIIPAAISKNGLAHRVPLSSLSLEILARAKCISFGSTWVFPSPRGNKPMLETAVGYALRRNLRSDRADTRQVLDIAHFTPHDLRRTAASLMIGLGISRLVVSKILYHTDGGITAVYDRHSYDEEKRRALSSWEKKLCSILYGGPDDATGS